MKVEEVMTRDVVTVRPDDPFKAVIGRMLARGVSFAPVVAADGRVIGVVSETDLLANEAFEPKRRGGLALLGYALGGHDAAFVRKASMRRAADLMTSEFVCVRPEDTVHTAARTMLDFGVNHLPVLDEGVLVGVVSRQDVLSVFRRPDEDIRADIERKLHDPLWSPEDVRVSVGVHDGVVSIAGSVRYESDGRVIEQMANAVLGVVAVDAEITAREPDPRLGPYLVPPLR